MKTICLLSYCGDEVCDDELLDAAYKYIDSQAERLIKAGDISGVLEEETSIMEELFGSKYKAAITEMCEYFHSLDSPMQSRGRQKRKRKNEKKVMGRGRGRECNSPSLLAAPAPAAEEEEGGGEREGGKRRRGKKRRGEEEEEG